MKKIFAFALVALAMSMVSCKKEKQPNGPEVVSVAEVKLDKTTLHLMEGETSQLTATVLPDNAENKKVTWSVDNTDVASVTDGLVMGLLEGTATVTVTTEDGGKTASCVVTVEAEIIPPSKVNILQDEYELEVGDEYDMTHQYTVDGSGDLSVTWTSSDPDVAVFENNKLIAKKAGTTTLKAAAVYGDKYDECLVKVYDTPTGAQLLRDGVALSESNPVDFEFSEEVTFEVKVLPATAKQDNWSLVSADGDQISDFFEMSGMDTNTPKLKAIKDGTIRINLCYGATETVAEYFEFSVGPKLELTATADEGFAGEGITLSTNIAGAEWSATYASRTYSVYMGNHPGAGLITLVATPGTSSVKILPLPMFKKSGSISNAPVTVKVQTAHQTAEYVVTSKAWRPYFMDMDTKQELRVDDVCVGQSFSVGLKDASGQDIPLNDWKNSISLKMGSADAYILESTRLDGYIYMFEEGAQSYKIEFVGSYDKTVRYEQDFSPSL